MINKLQVPEKFRKRMGVDFLFISSSKKGNIGQSLKIRQQWEPHIQNVLGSIIRPDDVFLDIGANIGIHTVFASKLAKEVIAIEPNKETFKHLLKTIEINNCNNVTCHNIGLWDQDEIRLFCHIPMQPGWSHFTTIDYCESNAITSDIEVKRLDNLKLPHIDIVKIDVEGVEKFVLRGGGKIFDECPILFIELNPPVCFTNTGKSILDTMHQIMSFGYEYIYYAHPTTSYYQITLTPHRDAIKPVIWEKTNFENLIKIMKKQSSATDAIFMPPGKIITGL